MNDELKHTVFDGMYLRALKRDAHIVKEANSLGQTLGIDDPVEAWLLAVNMIRHRDNFEAGLREVAERLGLYRKSSITVATNSPLLQLFAQLGMIQFFEGPDV
jgi:hypothetical protein